MRRLSALVVLAAALLLAGCASPPPGTDGDIGDDWSALPEPRLAPPAAVGTCHDYRDASTDFSLTSSFLLIEFPDSAVTTACVTADTSPTTAHDTETAYVGEFTGADAGQPLPPSSGSLGRRAAYAKCLTGASSYLGGDWHRAAVWILLVLPSDNAWRGGARWFRCDLGHVENVFNNLKVAHGSVRDGLSGSQPLAITCMTTEEDADGSILRAAAAGCDKPHAAEYAGVYTAPNRSWPSDDEERADLGLNGCEEVVARYLGFPNAAAWHNNKIGYWYLGFDQERWELGDRTARCFAYAFTASKVIIGSVKGIRTGTPKS